MDAAQPAWFQAMKQTDKDNLVMFVTQSTDNYGGKFTEDVKKDIATKFKLTPDQIAALPSIVYGAQAPSPLVPAQTAKVSKEKKKPAAVVKSDAASCTFTPPTIPPACNGGCPSSQEDCKKCSLNGCKWVGGACTKVWERTYLERKTDVVAAFESLNLANAEAFLTHCAAMQTNFDEDLTSDEREQGKTYFGGDETTLPRDTFFDKCPDVVDATSRARWAETTSQAAIMKYVRGNQGLIPKGWAEQKHHAKMSTNSADKDDQMCRFRVRHYLVVCMMNTVRTVYSNVNPRAVGSAKPDSDYDVGLSGPDTLKFIALITHMQRTYFGVPSSFMFDTNYMVASAFDWMKSEAMKDQMEAANIEEGYDMLATRPSKNWYMAILKPPAKMNNIANENKFYNFELQAAHSKLCYFADTTCTDQAFQFSKNCGVFASQVKLEDTVKRKEETMKNDVVFADLMGLKTEFEEKYTNNPACNEEQQLTGADDNFIDAIYQSNLWDKGSFAPEPETNQGKDFLEWQDAMTRLQIISQEAYHTIGPLIVTVVLSDIMVGAFSKDEYIHDFWPTKAQQWVAHIPLNYLQTAIVENYGDMYKEYSKEVVKTKSPSWTEFVFMSVKYLSRVCEAALALNARRDAIDQLAADEAKLIAEVGATTAWIKDALRSKQGTYSDDKMTLEMPSEQLGKELLLFAKDVYVRMLSPFDPEKDAATKTVSLPSKSSPPNYKSVLLEIVRAQFFSSFSQYMHPDKKKANSRLAVDHLKHQFWGGHMPAFLIPDMKDPQLLSRDEAVVQHIDEFSKTVEATLSKYPWTKWVANVKAFYDESPNIRIELNQRFGIIKSQAKTYVIETMAIGSESVRNNVVVSLNYKGIGPPEVKPGTDDFPGPPQKGKAVTGSAMLLEKDKTPVVLPKGGATSTSKNLVVPEPNRVASSIPSRKHYLIVLSFLLVSMFLWKRVHDKRENNTDIDYYLLDVDEI